MQVYGFDLNRSYKNLFLTRLDERKIISTDWHYFIEDSRNIKKYLAPSSVDICITSPPYWNILHQKRSAHLKESIIYSNDESDLGNIENYFTFIDELARIFEGVHFVLKNKGYLILN